MFTKKKNCDLGRSNVTFCTREPMPKLKGKLYQLIVVANYSVSRCIDRRITFVVRYQKERGKENDFEENQRQVDSGPVSNKVKNNSS